MILLTIEEIIELHSVLIEKTGGSDGVRDLGLLQSAIFSAQNAFEDKEVYPTIEEKSARLMFSLINNHAFVDGNKRIGIFVMLMSLQLNDVLLNYTQQELIDLGLSTASGKTEYEEILKWINAHKL